ncbi:MAG: DUF2029 domain-containing protein [Chloroflexales bacterium]|nr:DUF2029 domain-containing protein [Chloroflexales bacterium]
MPDSSPPRSPFWQIGGVFLVLTVFTLVIAHVALEPYEYYGTITAPRFADDWVARAETIVGGGLLYRDVETMSPPLINLLLVPPTLVSGWFGHHNPGATLAFVLYFALFSLATAYLLLYQAGDRADGRAAALAFLFNPLTLGNAILRRQDEAILVFAFAVVLVLIARRANTWASVAIGATLLIKLTGALLIPLALLATWRRRTLVVPPLIFALGMLPFLLSAGPSAFFWDVSRREGEHPFQFSGLNPAALWYIADHRLPPQAVLLLWSGLFVVGVVLALGWITLRPRGLWEDTSLLVGVTLLLTPKLHCGYLALLALTLAPLVPRYRIGRLVWLAGLLALVADFVKWPAEQFHLAAALMVIVFILLGVILWRIRRDPAPPLASIATQTQRVGHQRWVYWAVAATLVSGVPVLTIILATPQAQRYDIGVPADYLSAATLFERETHSGASYRWTRPGSALTLSGAFGGPSVLRLRLFHQEQGRALAGQLSLLAGGQKLASLTASPGWRVYQIALPAQALAAGSVGAAPLVLMSTEYQSGRGDARHRGVAVDWAAVDPAGGAPVLAGHALYQALLLISGLALVLGVGWYLLLIAAPAQAATWAALLGAGGALALAAITVWAARDLPSLAWSFPLTPAMIEGGALLLGGLAWLTLPDRCSARWVLHDRPQGQ